MNITTNAGRNIIAVIPDNPDFVLVAGVNLRGLTDGCINWKTGIAGWDIFRFIFDKHQPDMIFFASENGVQLLNLATMTTRFLKDDIFFFNPQTLYCKAFQRKIEG